MVPQTNITIAAGYAILAFLVTALICRAGKLNETRAEGCSHALCVDEISFIQVPLVNKSKHQQPALARAIKPQHALLERAHPVNFSDSSWAAQPFTGSKYLHHWRWGPIHASKSHRGLEEIKAHEWAMFAFGILVFGAIQQNAPASKSPNAGLALWLGLGMAFACCAFAVLGFQKGEMWLSGYVLELFFSLDNCFAVLIVSSELHLPRDHARRAFRIIVYSQIFFETVCFLGLAARIAACGIVPYVLGIWLIYTGYMALALEHKVEHDEAANVEDLYIARVVKSILGDNFLPRYESGDDSPMIVSIDGTQYLTMLPIAILVLMFVNFALEVDVVLLKIEMFNSHILAFTSSAVATFALPEIFLMVEDMFERYRFLKHGISLVLMLEGIAFLLHTLVVVSAMEQIVFIIFVMLCCVFFSEAFPSRVLDLESPKGDKYRRRLTM